MTLENDSFLKSLTAELGLEPHPEGGSYAETWRDEHASAIYYVLRAGAESAWHRVCGRGEVWHHYAGAPLRLEISDDGQALQSLTLGTDINAGERPQIAVPAGSWQSATPLGEWTLVGCTVAPPFTFDAFELAPAGWAPGRFGPLVSAGWLAEHRDEVALIDVRWYPDGRSGRDAHAGGHLPGAVWLDLDQVLADPPSSAQGRHPLPTPERFAAGLSAAGIGDATRVVAYDDNGGMAAGRLIWLLRALGHPAALLDGGLQAWTGDLDTTPVSADAEAFTARDWPRERFATLEEVADISTGISTEPLLLDARAPERFRGDVEPLDPRAGHIPGAANAPWPANIGASQRYRPAAALRAQLGTLGAAPDRDVVVYCGSGVTACQTLLALEAAGIENARLYPGSWSQWCADPDRPAALGN
ncbi:MAG TPA: cupin domain-containing protein [Frankiaceae bacterium]|nr:cupin domain-containing protein [Frankiaceae bacterium]